MTRDEFLQEALDTLLDNVSKEFTFEVKEEADYLTWERRYEVILFVQGEKFAIKHCSVSEDVASAWGDDDG